MLFLLVSLAPSPSPAQDAGITRKHHPWGRFEVGAWKRVREVTETFDQSRAVVSITETKTTVKKVEEDGVTLLVEQVVDVGGKRIHAEPQLIKQGWHGELANQQVKVSHLGQGSVRIQDLKVPCKIQQLELTGATSKTVTNIYYSDTFPPYILKRESVRSDLEGKTQLGKTVVEVIDVNVPCRLLANIFKTFYVKAVHEHAKGKTVTLIDTSMRVPGGVIRRTSNDFDSDGKLMRRSRLSLLDYGLAPGEKRIGLFSRKRLSRPRRLQRFSPYRFQPPAGSQR
jgi:hypothetical protein